MIVLSSRDSVLTGVQLQLKARRNLLKIGGDHLLTGRKRRRLLYISSGLIRPP